MAFFIIPKVKKPIIFAIIHTIDAKKKQIKASKRAAIILLKKTLSKYVSL
jgi:hypothetical protein